MIQGQFTGLRYSSGWLYLNAAAGSRCVPYLLLHDRPCQAWCKGGSNTPALVTKSTLMTILIAAAIVLGAVSLLSLLTTLVRRFALSAHLLDIPDERYSRVVPMPCRGEVGISARRFALAIVVVGLLGLMKQRQMIAGLGSQVLA